MQSFGTTNICSDGKPCTVGDKCSYLKCVAGPAKQCGEGNPCAVDVRNSKTGSHTNTPLTNIPCASKTETNCGCTFLGSLSHRRRLHVGLDFDERSLCDVVTGSRRRHSLAGRCASSPLASSFALGEREALP